MFDVRAKIMSLTGYSVHADRGGLFILRWEGIHRAKGAGWCMVRQGAKRALLEAIKQACLPQGQEVKVVIG